MTYSATTAKRDIDSLARRGFAECRVVACNKYANAGGTYCNEHSAEAADRERAEKRKSERERAIVWNAHGIAEVRELSGEYQVVCDCGHATEWHNEGAAYARAEYRIHQNAQAQQEGN